MKPLLSFPVVAMAILLSLATHAPAAIVSVTGDTGDVILRGPAQPGILDRVVDTIGSGGSNSDGRTAILFFELPTGITSSADVTAANLKLNLVQNAIGAWESPNFWNGDLYGIGFQSTTTPDTAWYYQGESDNSTGTGVGINDRMLLQDNFTTRSTSVGVVESDASGDAGILAFVKAAYDAGATAGDFLVLRLNPDRNVNGSANQGYYRFVWGGGVDPYDSDDVTAYGPYIPPVLELTTASATIPAPAALPAGLALLAAVGLRRHRRA